jgi:hypothetical protein
MTVCRCADGGVLVHSAINLDEAGMAQVDALGPVRTIVVPNGFHRMDAAAWRERYPKARVLCPTGSKKRVQQAVPVDGGYEDLPPDADVGLETLSGTGQREGILLVRSAGGVTLVVNDILFNMPHAPGFMGFLLRHVTQSSAGLRVTRLARLALIKDASAVRKHLRRLVEVKGLRRLIVSHHQMVEGDVASAILEALKTL